MQALACNKKGMTCNPSRSSKLEMTAGNNSFLLFAWVRDDFLFYQYLDVFIVSYRAFE